MNKQSAGDKAIKYNSAIKHVWPQGLTWSLWSLACICTCEHSIPHGDARWLKLRVSDFWLLWTTSEDANCLTPHTEFRGVQPMACRLWPHAHVYFVWLWHSASICKFHTQEMHYWVAKNCHKKSHQLGMIMYTFNLSGGRQRQVDVCEFEVGLVYTVRLSQNKSYLSLN